MQHPAHVFAAKRGKIRAGDGELAQRDAVAAQLDLPDGVRALQVRLQMRRFPAVLRDQALPCLLYTSPSPRDRG